jgi:hypothetical protein
MFEMPKPTEHHQKLNKLVGQWKGEEKMYPSQWDPKGGMAMGHNHARVSLDGFAVVADYHQERDGQVTYQGHAVWTWDAKENCYTMHWFDSMGSPPEVFKGNFDGERLTVSSHGAAMHARMTYDFSQGSKLKSKMEMSPDGESWNTLFDAEYVKK